MRVPLGQVQRRQSLHGADEGPGAGERLEREPVGGVLDVAGPAVRQGERGQPHGQQDEAEERQAADVRWAIEAGYLQHPPGGRQGASTLELAHIMLCCSPDQARPVLF